MLPRTTFAMPAICGKSEQANSGDAMLKRIEAPGKSPIVCGYKRSKPTEPMPHFHIPTTRLPLASNRNSIRTAALTDQPIYAAVENILLNNSLVDCAIAAALKNQAILDCLAGRPMRMPTDQDALWLYSQCSAPPPFNPITRANDN